MAFNTPTKPGNQTLLGKKIGANMNSTSNQAISMLSDSYIIRKIVVTNASTNLTTAVGGLNADSGGSTALVGSGQVYSALTASAKFVDLTLATAATTEVRTEGTIYLKLATPQGATATSDLYIFGDKLD